VVHLLRGAARYCTYKDRKAVFKALRPIYTAVNPEAAAEAMDDFELTWGDRHPGVVRLWRDCNSRVRPHPVGQDGVAFQIDLGVRKPCELKGMCGSISVSHISYHGEVFPEHILENGYEFLVNNFSENSDPPSGVQRNQSCW
jgi:hypothetical protein